MKDYHNTRICIIGNHNIKLNNDMVDAILDTGYYTKISCSKKLSITYKKEFIRVEGIGSHHIVGTGTIKYTVIDDNGHTVNLMAKNKLYVPTLGVQ